MTARPLKRVHFQYSSYLACISMKIFLINPKTLSKSPASINSNTKLTAALKYEEIGKKNQLQGLDKARWGTRPLLLLLL